jgi:hypothetical protein
MREFVPDVWRLFSELLRIRASRFGIPSRTRPSRNDPYRAWKEEAQVWVDRLVRQADRTHDEKTFKEEVR